MVTTADAPRVIHPLHAVLLAGAFPLFLGGLFSDWAYNNTFEVQWNNFAAWLIAGAMVFTGFALLWSLIDLLRGTARRGWGLTCFFLLLAMFVLGLINSFVHARDAFGSQPQGVVLSVIVTLLAIGAIWIGFSTLRARVRP